MFLPAFPSQFYLAPLVIALLTPAVLAGVSWLVVKWRIKPAYYPLNLIGLGIAGLVILHVVNPSLLGTILGSLGRIFAQPATKLTILESQPILFPSGNFSLSVVWTYFTTNSFLSFISLGILIYFTIKRGETDKTLFIVWSIMILLFTLAMRRFALLFAVNVALLAGYLSWLILAFTGFKQTTAKTLETPEKVKKAKKKRMRKGSFSLTERKGGFRLSERHIYMAFGIVVVFFLSFFPNIGLTRAEASRAPFTPSNAWSDSLFWLKDNTPDPFGNPDFYYNLYETPFHYPETTYGVAARWDYGYWIIRIGHRLPNCDPGGGERAGVGRFLTAQNEASANKRINKLGSKYVIIDYATTTGMFHALATYAGSSAEEFYEDYYYQTREGKLEVGTLFYPAYYRSLVVRLYHFEGGEVTPQSSYVLSYEEKVRQDGTRFKEIINVKSFPTYEEAEAYISSQKTSNHYRIVSNDPFVSPVPLAALEHYKLIYSSDDRILHKYGGSIPEVKIFEYIGD
jgi:asparagine N-glycosylation enzyme membrane subunit Stt3